MLDEPDVVRKKLRSAVTDSGHARSGAARTRPGSSNLIEILAVVRGVDPDEVEREFEGSGYGDFKAAVAEEVVEFLAPVRERYAELRADEAGARGDARRRRREGARDRRRRRSPTSASAMGVGPPALAASGWLLSRAMRVAELELDLDVFAGPFDLLMALVLREEVSLLEVDLARGRARLPRAPRGRGRARPRGRRPSSSS